MGEVIRPNFKTKTWEHSAPDVVAPESPKPDFDSAAFKQELDNSNQTDRTTTIMGVIQTGIMQEVQEERFGETPSAMPETTKRLEAIVELVGQEEFNYLKKLVTRSLELQDYFRPNGGDHSAA